MAVDPLDDWKKTFKDIPPADLQPLGTLNLAKWYWDRIQNIQPDPKILDTTAEFTFVFAVPTFASGMAAMPPVPDQFVGVASYAAAWETAILLTVFPATLNVAPGAFIGGTSTPSTTFSSVTSVILDPPSVVAAKAKIMELATTPQAKTTDESKKPDIMLEATKLLTITVTGLDNTPSPAGPLPLTAPLVPLI